MLTVHHILNNENRRDKGVLAESTGGISRKGHHGLAFERGTKSHEEDASTPLATTKDIESNHQS